MLERSMGNYANRGTESNASGSPIKFRGGDEGIRTLDPHVANVVLSQKICTPSQKFSEEWQYITSPLSNQANRAY